MKRTMFIFAVGVFAAGLLAASGETRAANEAQDSQSAGIGRYLLVASEGLYVVEADGHCSWFYNVPPLAGQSAGKFDDLVYDGWALPNGHFLYSAARYVREVDRDKRTVWEYRVKAPHEVKTCVPLEGGRVAILHSGEQAILELESGSGRITHRIPLPATGTDHTRYNLLRRTPQGTYLAALRNEKRFVEVTREGKVLSSFSVPSLPFVAERLSDGSTVCAGMFGVKKFDTKGKELWSFTPKQAAPHFPMIIAAGIVALPKDRFLVVNSDWHYKNAGDNRVPLFILGADLKPEWTLDISAFDDWKHSEVEPRTGFAEHRSMVVQLLGPKR